MSNTKDKSVPNERLGVRAPRRKKSALVSDAFTKAEVELLALESQLVPGAWEAELGRRIEFAVHQLGKDQSVHLLGLSWKQLQRYFAGDSTVGASTLSSLATATRLSVGYLIEGRVFTAGDLELERRIVDRRIDALHQLLEGFPAGEDRRRFERFHRSLVKESQNLATLVVSSGLADRGAGAGEVDLSASTRAYASSAPARPGKSQVPSNAVEVGTAEGQKLDEDLLSRTSEGVAAAYKGAGARLSPADHGRTIARILNDLIAAYDSPSDRIVGLKLALERLRADLRKAPIPGDTTGKRLA